MVITPGTIVRNAAGTGWKLYYKQTGAAVTTQSDQVVETFDARGLSQVFILVDNTDSAETLDILVQYTSDKADSTIWQDSWNKDDIAAGAQDTAWLVSAYHTTNEAVLDPWFSILPCEAFRIAVQSSHATNACDFSLWVQGK